MHKLSSTEAAALQGLVRHGRATQVFEHVIMLRVGEALQIDSADWHGRYPIHQVFYNIKKKHKYRLQVGRLPHKAGWLVKRIG